MRAVVKTEDIAGTSSGGFGAISEDSLRMVGDGLQARNKPFRRFLLPISRNQRPHDRAVAEIAGRRNDPGISQPKWRPKPLGRRAQRIGNRVVAEAQLNPDLCGRQPQKIRVRCGVIPDGVSASDDFFQQFRTFAHVSPNQEKCRLCVVAVEKFEQLWRDRGIRPVIKGNRQLARRIGPANRAPKKLRARINGAIGEGPRSCQRPTPGDEQRIHAERRPEIPQCRRLKHTASCRANGCLRRLLSQSETILWIRDGGQCRWHFPIWNMCKLQILNILTWKFERFFYRGWCSYCNEHYCVRVPTIWRSSSRKLRDSQSFGFSLAFRFWTDFRNHARSFPGFWTRPAT